MSQGMQTCIYSLAKDIPVILTYFKPIDVSGEPSAVVNITEMVIDAKDTIKTATNANSFIIEISACIECELANAS